MTGDIRSNNGQRKNREVIKKGQEKNVIKV